MQQVLGRQLRQAQQAPQAVLRDGAGRLRVDIAERDHAHHCFQGVQVRLAHLQRRIKIVSVRQSQSCVALTLGVPAPCKRRGRFLSEVCATYGNWSAGSARTVTTRRDDVISTQCRSRQAYQLVDVHAVQEAPVNALPACAKAERRARLLPAGPPPAPGRLITLR